MKAPRAKQNDSYSLTEVLGLTAFRPDLQDHAYPLEQRLRQHGIKELVVLASDGATTSLRLLTRGRRGAWVASELTSVAEIGARAVIGVFAAPDVPAVLRISQKSDALLANILASSPRKAMVEGVSDDSIRVQAVRVSVDRHIVWRILASTLQRFERPVPGDATLVRVTHGLAPVVRLAIESTVDASVSPDAIICGDHRNFIWFEMTDGNPNEAIRPREIFTEDDLFEWLENIAADIPTDRNYRISIWVSPFCWMQALPATLAARLPAHLKFEVKQVPLADLVFA